jgi:hypothetical protein
MTARTGPTGHWDGGETLAVPPFLAAIGVSVPRVRQSSCPELSVDRFGRSYST